MLRKGEAHVLYFRNRRAGDGRFPRPFYSLEMYMYARMLDFQHLPEEGGMMDQDPMILDDWGVIRGVDNEINNPKSGQPD